MITRLPAALLFAITAASAQTPDQVLVVVNRRSDISRQIGDYYMRKRAIPGTNLCTINTAPVETVERPVYASEIEKPIGAFLSSHGLTEKVLYIVLTSGVPLRITGGGAELKTDAASVDSELTVLYSRLHSVNVPLTGPITNPFFGRRNTQFQHPAFPMYLVTRLDGYTLDDMRALVDRSLAARNAGKFVIDLKARETTPGNQWLRTAALLLPENRVVLDDSSKVITGIKDVIAYASWGSNDTDRKQRFLHFTWLPGAIATEFVSTDARTFRKPPDSWEIGTWGDKKSWYGGAPQSLTADYIHEGATGASGQVYEPYLAFCPRPDFVLPAWYTGRNLAESFYVGIPALSWMNVVVGDPLTRLK
ncbi:MAG TPA: TIGR03790 family protein [Bryobacteraceae bacterium]|nr:TIGR03790 family protein [Bryobacteraceae bacterium]